MKIVLIVAFLLGIASNAIGTGIGRAVDVEIISDGGVALPLYPVVSGSFCSKAYAEARKGERYSIIVRNRLNRRVGVVVAVDGRNIVSGKKSWLRNSERMYILGPYESGEFKGWRTGLDRINRFFFTSAADSYAAAFNDESAMGVIAVAVYPEIARYREYDSKIMSKSGSSGTRMPSAREESAGTGFGREEYSPVTLVEFSPQARAAEKIYIKYEWRSTLCRKGIISCSGHFPSRNRMWNDEGFAPYPPGWLR